MISLPEFRWDWSRLGPGGAVKPTTNKFQKSPHHMIIININQTKVALQIQYKLISRLVTLFFC